MDQQRLEELAGKFLAGTATDSEQAELHAWYDAAGAAGELPGDRAELEHRLYAGVQDRTRRPVRPLVRWMAAAAIFTAAIAAAGWLLLRDGQEGSGAIVSAYGADVLPGGDRATLTLADGTVIELDTARNGALGAQGGTRIAKAGGSQLVYVAGEESQGPPVYNTIATPRGGQYQIVLPDGSKVWLNAASSLRFPATFREGERRVELKGEAYFEVQGNPSQPFIVALAGMEVAVLGTRFNVSAYEREAARTVLLSGAVRVRNESGDAILKPGQAAELATGGHFRVEHDPEAEDAAAWKDGMFVFSNDKLSAIMEQLCRWYNVEAAYDNESLKGKIFTGQISRGEKLSEVLTMLEMTGTIHFRIDNGIVRALP